MEGLWVGFRPVAANATTARQSPRIELLVVRGEACLPSSYCNPMSHSESPAAAGWSNRPRLDPQEQARFFAGIAEAESFFVGRSSMQRALKKLSGVLEEGGIPYAILGGMALNAYGYRRVTVDVDVLLTHAGYEAFKARHLGSGYALGAAGAQRLLDTENDVPIDVVLAGEYPGDGFPKPVAFPDPAAAAVRGEHVALLPLPRLLELKLASGMTAPHRLRDLADVIELVRILQLPEELAGELDPYVRDKFRELWRAAQTVDPE